MPRQSYIVKHSERLASEAIAVHQGAEPFDFTSAFHGWRALVSVYKKWDVPVPRMSKAEYDAFMQQIRPSAAPKKHQVHVV